MNQVEKFHPQGFAKWAENKLQSYAEFHNSGDGNSVSVELEKPLSDSQKQSIASNIKSSNLCFLEVKSGDNFQSDHILEFARSLGLSEPDANICSDEDRLSRITVTDHKQISGGGYIPYTDKPLGWHTDGYYNPYNQRIRSFLLACETAADLGGENSFIDPEIIYILMYRENPLFVQALMDPSAMTIPENKVDGVVLRDETRTSVFQISDDNLASGGTLDMRYSQRKRFIEWNDDPLINDAVEYLDHLLDDNNVEFDWLRIRKKMKAGEAVICNNVLHKRTAFSNNENSPRVMYRARFYQRISIS